MTTFNEIHDFFSNGGLASILDIAKVPVLLIGVDQDGLPRTKVTLHTSVLADDVSETVAGLFKQAQLDVDVTQKRHSFPKRAKDKTIAALAERFSHEWLAYDPVGGARVLRAINDGAKKTRELFGSRISGLYWLHNKATLQVVLDDKVIAHHKERPLTLLRDCEAILRHEINRSLSSVSTTIDMKIVPSFEQPTPEGVPVDIESLKHSAEYGVLFGRSITPPEIMHGLPFESPTSRMKPVQQKVAAASVAALIGLTPACGGGGGSTTEEQFTGSPSAVSGITAVAGDAQNVVSWGAATGASSYTLYWDAGAVSRSVALASDCSGDSFSGITDLSFIHTGLTNGTSYNYNVTGVDADGDEGECSGSGAAVTPTVTTVTVYGCADSSANNYDPNATEDDGSCTYAATATPIPEPDSGESNGGGGGTSCNNPLGCNDG